MTETTTSPPPTPRPPPRPALPQIPGPLETAVRTWRALRRMSTALMLLFALAAATVVATFIPQEPVIPPTVRDWRAGVEGPGEGVAAAFDALGLFDVYGSWWFLLLLALLLVSLTSCLVPRIRAFGRAARRPPAAGRNLARLTSSVALSTAMEPAAVLEAARQVLRRRRMRVRIIAPEDSPTGNAQLAAERGHWREGGSLVFHVSFYVLLAGAVIGHAFGFHGQINVVEGERFAETRIAYGNAEPGRFFSLDEHRGFVVELVDFDLSYHAPPPGAEEGEGFVPLTPREFVSTVAIAEGGGQVRTGQVRVNHPLEHDGMKLYQIRFGYAPRITVHTAGGAVLFDDAVPLAEEAPGIWTGVAKVAATEVERQIALEIVLLTDAAFTADGIPFSRSPEARNPRLAAVLWYGSLGLERNIPASQFDRDAGNRLEQPVILAPGASGSFEPLGVEVHFADLPFWSGFQVSHEPGRALLILGSILLLGGLIPSLYSYRRRLWVDVQASGGGSDVVLAGVSLQRRAAFTESFDEIADDLRVAVTAQAQE